MAQPMDPQQDDHAACFKDFYRREYRRLMAVVVLIGGTLDEADDAVSEAMVGLWRRWSVINNPRAYARKAVVNTFVKQKKRDRERPDRAAQGGHLTPEAEECSGLTAWEDKQWVDQLVCLLPHAQREVVEAVFDGLTVEEISALFGRKPTTIRRCLDRATLRLAELRKERSHGQEGGEIR